MERPTATDGQTQRTAAEKVGARTGTGPAIVLHPFVKQPQALAPATARDPAARLLEAENLAAAIGLEIVYAAAIPLSAARPATLLGAGKVEEIGQRAEGLKPVVVVVDAAVTPVQQRNLEKAWKTKVLDRTGLILEIFGARARTKEGQMQVELAHLTYHKSRLVRQWTHLERQRGGFGFLGGPGETQIELDRRIIGDRIAKLKRELEDVKRTRTLHRSARKRVPFPVVALAGYTNAGKSTLFNALTQSDVLAEDKLFATLDPTMRGLTLPSGQRIILSDTVGFVSNLPTQLVAAFRATLEEVLEADLILHVRDAAHPDTEAQKADVLTVLSEIGLGERLLSGMAEVWNKIDLLPADSWRPQNATPDTGPIAVSAITGEGLDYLARAIDARMAGKRRTVRLTLPAADGAGIAWLHAHGAVQRNVPGKDGHMRIQATIPDALWPDFQRRFPGVTGRERAPAK
jgi:GTP-binding protein HflX